jgi:hypothetical protein
MFDTTKQIDRVHAYLVPTLAPVRGQPEPDPCVLGWEHTPLGYMTTGLPSTFAPKAYFSLQSASRVILNA